MSADEVKNIIDANQRLVEKISHIAEVYDNYFYSVRYHEWDSLRHLKEETIIGLEYTERYNYDSIIVSASIYIGYGEYEDRDIECPIKYFSMSDKEIVQDMLEFDKKERAKEEEKAKVYELEEAKRKTEREVREKEERRAQYLKLKEEFGENE